MAGAPAPTRVPPGPGRDIISFAAGPADGFPPLTVEHLRQLEDPASRGWAAHTLDVRGRDLQWPGSINTIRKSFVLNTSLRTVRFVGCGIGDADVEQILSPCLQLRPGGQVAFITFMDLSFNGITDKGLLAIGKALHNATSCLNTLSCRCNPISLSGFGKFLACNVPLQTVDFSWCNFRAKSVDTETEAALSDVLVGIRRNNRTKNVTLRGCAGYVNVSSANRMLDEAKSNKRSKLVASFGKLCHDINVGVEQGAGPNPQDALLRELALCAFPVPRDDPQIARAVMALADLDGWTSAAGATAEVHGQWPFPQRRKSTTSPPVDRTPPQSSREPAAAPKEKAAEPLTTTKLYGRHVDPAAAHIRDLLRPTFHERPKPTRIREGRPAQTAAEQQQQQRTRSVGFEENKHNAQRKHMLLYQTQIPDGLNYRLAGIKPPPKQSTAPSSRSASQDHQRGGTAASRSSSASSRPGARQPGTSRSSSKASSRSGSPDRPGLDRGAATRTLGAYCAANIEQFAIIFGTSVDNVSEQMKTGSAADGFHLSRPMPSALVSADGRPAVLQALAFGHPDRIAGLAKISFCVQHTGCPILGVPPAILAVMTTGSPSASAAEAIRQRSQRNAEWSRARKRLESLVGQRSAEQKKDKKTTALRREKQHSAEEGTSHAAASNEPSPARSSSSGAAVTSRYRSHSQDWVERRRRMNILALDA